MIRIAAAPILFVVFLLLGYQVISLTFSEDSRYAPDRIAETAMITAYDIRYGWGQDAGSHYTLGNLDGSFSSMIAMAPAAINVSLFRPYLWEASNPLMFIAAVEALFLLVMTIGTLGIK